MDSTPHIIIDDDNDDEFDWDAAVREIDVACQASKPSTSHTYTTPTFPSETALLNGSSVPISLLNKNAGASRQTTLDKFVGRAISRNEPVARDFLVCDSASVGGNDGISFVSIDADAARTWIYPVNIPLRDYQFAITKTALFSNTLVALPTGLGKTLIAAVVIYNYFRWFPEGKIVFTAPSRPLVMQQIEACHNIVGIPQDWTIDMTGQISPVKRASFWKSKRVFFVTPQVLEKDIQSGTCLVKYLVCLVIDEAHRALGNYSYSVVVRELMAAQVQLRILALTATPGSKQQTIQHVIDNLLISTLEYRNESDPDVSPYVHSRKIELIEVSMGKEASEISDLLLNVIRTYAFRLNEMGILLNRDYQTLSPSDLLNSRDKFRQAPPPELPQIKYGETERFFAVLITLYHMRKLLSSHGIKPAYEMLQEKLQQGSFANLMARNEDIKRAKLLMQHTVSHGAPNPKLSKMLEVLTDHFKKNDARNSRVIIFSNFRGSVRDIMDALSNLGDIIKAAQFIGQSAGKTVKGQSQKVQQAVLEKFRTGGYNVIVATSIGEEGLDIMEVDLVICFDANISPLRMVQRMGRTGRKHDGRVVVLACQGSELKGYMRKQASSKSIRKLMRNGGTASFNFHSSPRMVPHAFRPEVQFVELAIEKFVPRGKKTKDDQAVETPIVTDSLSIGETNLIIKYFHKSENMWRPSLIAFPHFQTFPSRVHKVMHSCQTGMLIDTMQCLQGLQFDRDEDDTFIKDETAPLQQADVRLNKKNDHENTDMSNTNSDSERDVLKNVPKTGLPPSVSTAETYSQSSPTNQKCMSHSYLFGLDFVSVDAHGNVLILSVPSLPFISFSAKQSASSKQFPNILSQHFSGASLGNFKELDGESSMLQNSSQEGGMRCESLSTFGLYNADAKQQEPVTLVEHPCTNSLDKISSKGLIHSGGVPEVLDANGSTILEDGLYNCLMETELSPRLTNYIASGVVPESPVNGQSSEKRSERPKQEVPITERVECEGNITEVSEARCAFSSPIHPSPLEDITNSSRNWYLSPTCISGSIKRRQKLKRLQRYGDCPTDTKNKDMKDNPTVGSSKHAQSSSNNNLTEKGSKHGRRKRGTNARAYIEEEAEVSSGADISEDEEDYDNSSLHDDSFIDDRVNPTAASSLDVAGTVDMMAIYRRSLLSQSPVAWKPNFVKSPSVDSYSSARRISESESFTAGTSDSLHVPQAKTIHQSAERNSRPVFKERQEILEAMPSISLVLSKEANKAEGKRRKMLEGASVPTINLEREFLRQANVTNEEISHENPVEEHSRIDISSDDQFYDGLDLEEVEAQATFLLKNSSQFYKQTHQVTPKLDSYSVNYLSSPSFDLGI